MHIKRAKEMNDKIVFIEPLKKAGCWVIGGDFHVYVTKRPGWLARKMNKFFMEWEWQDGDYEEQQKKASEK